MKTPLPKFPHHRGVPEHHFGVKTPLLATLFKNFTHNFFVYSKLLQVPSNHATSWVRWFFFIVSSNFSSTGGAEQIILKMENGNHLEVAEFSKLNPNYLKSVKKVRLGKQFQVSGYFCVEQTSFLWMVHL